MADVIIGHHVHKFPSLDEQLTTPIKQTTMSSQTSPTIAEGYSDQTADVKLLSNDGELFYVKSHYLRAFRLVTS